MAFMGVGLGLLSRVAVDQGLLSMYDGLGEVSDPETGLPLLIKYMYPVGLTGLMLSAYFSAILSTADSCLMAASGNVVTDLNIWSGKDQKSKRKTNSIRKSQIATLVIGVLAILLAWQMEEVLSLMLYSYAFMVSGLLIPVLAALFLKNPSANGALAAMIIGGSTTLILQIGGWSLPMDLDANAFGISASFVGYILGSLIKKNGYASVLE